MAKKQSLKSGSLYKIANSSTAKLVAVKKDLNDLFSDSLYQIGVSDVFMFLQEYPVSDLLGMNVKRIKLMTGNGTIGYIFFVGNRVKFTEIKI